MKVLLLKDVKGIGRAHEQVETKDGFALNFLIPQKLAISATPSEVGKAEFRLKQVVEQQEVDMKLLEQNLISLAEAHIVINKKVNEKGHLYDAVSVPEIIQATKEQTHIDLPEDSIKLEKPIKEIGTFKIPISLKETFGAFSITIEAE